MRRVQTFLYSLAFLCLSFTASQAQRFDELFMRMPSSLLPQLAEQQRQPLLDAAKLPAELESDLGGSIKLLRREPFIQLSTSSVSELYLLLLPIKGQASKILLLNSVSSPYKDTALGIYSLEWEAEPVEKYWQMPSIERFFASREAPAELIQLFQNNSYLSISPSEDGAKLFLELDSSILSEEDQKRFQQYLQQPLRLVASWQDGSFLFSDL